MPVFAQAEVDPGVAAAADRLKAAQGGGLDLGGQVLRQLRRSDIAGAPALVFRFVVVEAAFGDDLHHRQHLIAQHRHGQLPPGHELLQQHAVAVAVGGGQGGIEIIPIVDDAQPHRGALGVGFDHQGQPEFFHFGAVDWLMAKGMIPGRSGHPGGEKHELGEMLVHPDGAGQGVAAGVGNARELQHRLQLPVLAVPPVEGDEGDVEFVGDEIVDRLEDVAVEFCLLLLDVRRCGLDDAGGAALEINFPVAVGAVERLHRMPAGLQRFGNRHPGGNRHIPLRGGAA